MNIDISLANLINTVFIGVGLGVCSLSILHVGAGMHIRKEIKKYFQ